MRHAATRRARVSRPRGLGARLLAASLVLGGAGGLVGASLAQQGCSTPQGPPPSALPPIVVGVSLGLTKGLASTSAPLRQAVLVAEGEINAGGGLLGRQVRFDIQDDRSDEEDYVAGIAQGFVDRGVAAVIGPAGSGQVKAVAGTYGGAEIIELSPTATSVELTTIQSREERFFFRTTPADDFQGAAVILLATKTPRGLGDGGISDTCDRLALVYLDNSYGTSMAKVVRVNFPKRGAAGQRKVVIEKKIPLEPRASYEADVAAVVAAQPQCLALIAYDDTAAQLVRDLRAAPGYAALEQAGFFVIGTDGVFTQGFLDRSQKDPSNPASESSALGVYGTNPDTQPNTNEYNAFKAIYGAYFPLAPGADAPSFAANAFDAAILIAFAIQKAGTVTDRVAIRDALKDVSKPPGRSISPAQIGEGLEELRTGGDIDYKGASGNVDFDDDGNVTAGFIVWQVVREKPSSPVTYKTVARFTTEQLLEQVK
jgi:ABC-type branched-subunit amino acid transport system substrate-binding protein